MKYVYAFQWCDCVYESGFTTISLHETYAGAYKAMRKEILKEWEEGFEQAQWVEREWNKLHPRIFNRWTNPFWNKNWIIEKLEIQP
jgi:hypothetical protein